MADIHATTVENNIKVTLKDSGPQGIQGPQGDIGPEGPTGPNIQIQVSGGYIQTKLTTEVSWTNLIAVADLVGATGPTGATGPQGGFGGNSFEYDFSTTTTDADPGGGILRFNHATFASITKIFIDDADVNAADIQAWLATLDDSTSTIKGFLKVFKKSDASVYRIFAVTAITEATGYWKIDVTPLVTNGSLSDTNDIVVSFGRTGDKGNTGDTGPQGIQGEPGTGEVPGGVSGNFVKINASEQIADSGYDPTDFAAALGADDNYVTDAEKTKITGIEALADVTDAQNVGSSIHGATGKTTPVNADTMPIIDSEASNVLKKLTFTNLKAFLKTYFDTLYQAVGSYLTASSTDTLTNKRITPRVGTTTSSATPTINTDNVDMFTITALAAAITSFTTNLSGTPTNGQTLIIRIKDDGTARAIAWGASFASRGVTLPTTTVLGKYLYVGFIWNSTTSTWDCVASAQEA